MHDTKLPPSGSHLLFNMAFTTILTKPSPHQKKKKTLPTTPKGIDRELGTNQVLGLVAPPVQQRISTRLQGLWHI